ncbi:MAG: threonylcarbamoyl-AMP synthase [Planctomycetes bacterium]|nr:threonylcarbamoyl-AMP synthase [Planctomycetota bacterium]
MVTVHRPLDDVIRQLAEVLRGGGLVAVPTETVYGLAADGTNAAACRRIFEVKERPTNDPLILHLHDAERVPQVAEFPEVGRRLAAAFWPGPLTMVLWKRPVVPDLVTAALASVAVRVPSHPVMLRLLAACELPLAAPSANPFGYVSPTTAEHVVASLGGRIEHVLDGGPCSIGVESTIVDLRRPDEPVLLRPGGVPLEDLEAVLGRPVALGPAAGTTTHGMARDDEAQTAPGQMTRHYSPRTLIRLHGTLTTAFASRLPPDEAALFLARPPVEPPPRNWRWLSDGGDLREAASHLFAVLRELDAGGYATLHAELAPDRGLGRALNDRLRRAAARESLAAGSGGDPRSLL